MFMTIRPFDHSTIRPFDHSIIRPFDHSTLISQTDTGAHGRIWAVRSTAQVSGLGEGLFNTPTRGTHGQAKRSATQHDAAQRSTTPQYNAAEHSTT